MHRQRPQRANKIRLPHGRHAHAPPGQVGQLRQWLFTKQHLGRIGIDGQQFDAVALAQVSFQIGTERSRGSAHARHVGAHAGQVGRRVLRILPCQRAHQHRTKRQHAQLHQAQHLCARHARAVKRHDIGAVAPLTQARKLLGPERLFVLQVLVDPRQPPHHTQLVRCRGGARLRQRTTAPCQQGQAHPAALARRQDVLQQRQQVAHRPSGDRHGTSIVTAIGRNETSAAHARAASQGLPCCEGRIPLPVTHETGAAQARKAQGDSGGVHFNGGS